MKIDVVTIFPDAFQGPFTTSIIGRAIRQGTIDVNIVDLRTFTDDARKTVDDKPYGGGPGMLMKPDPIFKAVGSLRGDDPDAEVVLTSPQGEVFNQTMALDLTMTNRLIIVCGHYEGVDERVRRTVVDREISIGDYVLTNGNLPAMVIVDAVARLLPGALGSNESIREESFSNGLLEYPQYTRPPVYRGMSVPDVLLSGDHGTIREWRRERSLERTRSRRPDLLNER